MSLKLSFNGEIKRVQIFQSDSENQETLTYENLLKIARGLFPKLKEMVEITFLWADDENDIVCCSSTEEVEEAMRVMGNDVSKKTYKFDVAVKDKGAKPQSEHQVDPSSVVHSNITCDICGMSPIVGVRYKCAVRENFDMCQSCEMAEVPIYPMIKIYDPSQSPAAILIALSDDNKRIPSNREEWKEMKHQMRDKMREMKHQFRGRGCGGRGPPPGRGPFGGGFGGRWGPFGQGPGRKNWRQHAQDTLAEVQAHLVGSESIAASPFLAATEAFAKSLNDVENPCSSYFEFDVRDTNQPAKGESVPVATACSVKSVHHEHNLAPVGPRRAQQARCDVCNVVGSCFYFCKSCDWDICSDCLSHESSGLEGNSTSPTAQQSRNVEEEVDEQLLRHAVAMSSKEEEDIQRMNQQLVDEVIRQSMEELESTISGVTIKSSAVDRENNVSNTEKNSATNPIVVVAKEVSVVSTNTSPSITAVGGGQVVTNTSASCQKANKPKARFVRDVTFPDGTNVMPGAVLRKTWRIRNDGTEAWPEGVTLASAGGDDLLSHSETAVPAPNNVNAGDEIELSVQLTVPEVAGRYVAYFRLCTVEGQFFGQRLWADLRVTEEETDWQVVSGLLSVPKAREDEVQSSVVDGAANIGTSSPPLVNSSVSALNVPATVEDLELQAPATTNSSDPIAVWATELHMLSEMGFTDSQACFPLLMQYVRVPVSLCPELNGTPPAEGIQRVVAALLGQSAGSF